jgi:bacterioferritin-associated ferredoxin
MFVCICRAVTEDSVREAIRDGASSVSEVESACRAGGDCGACRGTIENILDEHGCTRRSLPVVGSPKAA